MIKAIDEKCEGYLLDAFPINLEQAKAFEEFIGSPTKVIYLSLEQASSDINNKYELKILIKDIMVSRLLDRGNFDDKEDAIKKRCDTFQNECRPVLDKFAEKVIKVK